ncbi:MAG TPA: glycine--tRNA ligase subunit beta [Aquificaceae bacterium]|nr:glycine--tRNA ligase subunit beta [Aquificaceae bacterium]
MKDLLIEIGTEELPAGVILQAVEYLKERFSQILGRQDIKTYSTPRRLAFFVENFENKALEKEEVLWGPPVKVAYEEGKPTKALLAFLERNSASLEEVVHLQKGEGTYVAIKRVYKEDTPIEKLSQSFEEILQSVPFPKSMRWDSSSLRFSRPIRWICALYGEEMLPLSFGRVKASNITYGHRLLSSGPIEIKNPRDYLNVLKDNYVVADYKERLGMVLAFLKDEAYALGGRPLYPEGLEEEVANLVEFPFAVVGKFEEKYLELPQKVIMTVLAHHQRFFCVEKDEKLLPYFIAISNNYPKDGVIVKGYEKVIRARLEDALFFYREDLKRPLEELVKDLSGVVFHPKAGSMLEKVGRVGALALKIADILKLPEDKRKKIERASYLCKADLLTQMVRELDELQGYMGYIYALKQGEDPEVALALYEHYLPVKPGDTLPSNEVSAVLSVADKLDSINTLMAVGEIPKGSSDPYGIRRLAYGIYAVLDAFNWDINLREVMESIPPELEEFLKARLSAYLEPYGYDLVRAVLEVKDPLRPYEVIKEVIRLASLKEEEEFKNIVEAYRRVVRILPSNWGDDRVEENLFKEEEEKALWRSFKALEATGDLLALSSLKKTIDDFFDKVLVMDPDENIRRNRLALLFRIKRLFNKFADFSKVIS